MRGMEARRDSSTVVPSAAFRTAEEPLPQASRHLTLQRLRAHARSSAAQSRTASYSPAPSESNSCLNRRLTITENPQRRGSVSVTGRQKIQAEQSHDRHRQTPADRKSIPPHSGGAIIDSMLIAHHHRRSRTGVSSRPSAPAPQTAHPKRRKEIPRNILRMPRLRPAPNRRALTDCPRTA